MSKQIDFSKERRRHGRALTAAVQELVERARTVAEQQGIDLQAALDKAAVREADERRKLTERLQESVVPLFIGDDKGLPCVIGSCVLVRLNSDLFAFTAAHVIRSVASSPL